MKCIKCNEECAEQDKWCENCYYPGIDEKYKIYKDMLAEGYRNIDAAVLSGYKSAEEFYGWRYD